MMDLRRIIPLDSAAQDYMTDVLARRPAGYLSEHDYGGTWRSFNLPSCDRYYGTLTPLRDGKFALIGGGLIGGDPLYQALVVDVVAQTAEPMALDRSLPSTMVQHSVTTFDGNKLYLLGNVAANRWSIIVINVEAGTVMRMDPKVSPEGAVLIPNMHCHTAAAVTWGSNRIIVFGGASHGESHNRVIELNVERQTWKEIAPQGAWPEKRLYHCACVVDRRMFIFGGARDAKTTEATDVVFDELWMLDTLTFRWKLIEQSGNRPSRRGSAVFHYKAPYIYLFGGFDGKDNLYDMYRMHVEAIGVWQRVPLPAAFAGVPRWGTASAVFGNKLVVVGGFAEAEEHIVPVATPGAAVRTYGPTSTAMVFEIEAPSLKVAFARLIVAKDIAPRYV